MDTEDVEHIEDGLLLSHRKECNNAICSNMMQLDSLILSELSQKDKHHMMSLTCGYLKYGTNETTI